MRYDYPLRKQTSTLPSKQTFQPICYTTTIKIWWEHISGTFEIVKYPLNFGFSAHWQISYLSNQQRQPPFGVLYK